MSEYNEEIGSDQGIGMDQILSEAEHDHASWAKNDMPGTETLRRMILLADWASREPKRFSRAARKTRPPMYRAEARM